MYCIPFYFYFLSYIYRIYNNNSIEKFTYVACISKNRRKIFTCYVFLDYISPLQNRCIFIKYYYIYTIVKKTRAYTREFSQNLKSELISSILRV